MTHADSTSASQEERALLQRECRVFCTYLVRSEPTDYVVERYIEAHAAPALMRAAEGVDRALLNVARRHHWGAGLADAYAGLFARTGVLRSKLVLLFGILEASSPFHTELDRVLGGGVLRLAGIGFLGGATAVVATLVFGPVHLIVGGGGRG